MAMVAVLVWGWFSYRSLPQQEDPSFTIHDALLVTVFPGASSLQMEQLVTNKLEQKLGELDAISEMHSHSRSNVSIVSVLLQHGSPAQIAQNWEKVRAKVREVTLPDGCGAPVLETDYQTTATLLLAVTSPPAKQASGDVPRYSYRELEKAAELLEKEVQRIPSVNRVRKYGNVPEQVDLVLSSDGLSGNDVTPDEVAQAVVERNAVTPGGTLEAQGQKFAVHLSGEFRNVEELGNALIKVDKDGRPIYLKDVGEVKRGYQDPVAYSVEVLHRSSGSGDLRRERSVLLAVEMKQGSVIGRFGDDVRGVLAAAQSRLPEGMQVVTVSDQPAATQARIGQFTECFIEAVIVVVLVALFLMDWRTALLVAVAIPLTLSMTVGGMALLGIPLQQISIAALIVSLGMLVDDPVVAADGINRELADGQPREVAAWLGPFRLRRAILFGTLINIAAFLPLILLPGDVGTFIVALPIVVTLALASSRIVSVTFIPLLGYHLLKGQRGFELGGEVRGFFLFRGVDKLLRSALPGYRGILVAVLKHPAKTTVFAYGLLGASLFLPAFFGKQFFPPAERNQFLIDIQLPESASLVQTREVCEHVIQLLRHESAIESAAVVSGGTTPTFYYNLLPKEPAGNLAQVLVNTRRVGDVPALVARLRNSMDETILGARCVVKQLEQGPPIDVPVQIQITGDDLDVLRHKADEVAEVLRGAGGYKVHDDLGLRAPALQIDVDQEKAGEAGVTHLQIARVVQAAFATMKISELREGDRLIPVVVRLPKEMRDEAGKIGALPVRSTRGDYVRIHRVADVKVQPEYVSIGHSDKRRSVTVKCYSVVGELPSHVLEKARPAIDQIVLPAGYELEYAGEEKELRRNEGDMIHVVKISLALIGLALVVQLNSVSKALVVMLTVPLGLIGAFVGMAVTQASLGFTALLGMVSLAGVIVSHIIVLSDFIEEARAEGLDLRDALMQAGLVRLRAVLVTVLATVCGLIPLALSGGELWRPLTSVHIFGLLLATALTLVLLPVLYFLFCAKLRFFK